MADCDSNTPDAGGKNEKDVIIKFSFSERNYRLGHGDFLSAMRAATKQGAARPRP
jgi:hypothetical protein